MVFQPYGGLHLDYIPDDIIVPELIFNPRYGRRPLSQSNKAVLIDAPSGIEFGIKTLEERTESLAKGLQKELGVEVGWDGVIGLFAPNHIDSSTVFWATHRLGGAVSPANPAYGSDELAYQLKDSGSIALITSSALLSTAFKAIENMPAIPKHRVFLIDGQKHESQKTVEQLVQNGRRAEGLLKPLKLAKGEAKTRVAFISYSSGTTGLPKGVMISHYNVIANVLQADLLEKQFDNLRRDTTMVLLPLYHIYGLVYVLHAELYFGNTCVIVPAFDFTSFLSYIEKYRMTRLFLVPPLVIRLVKDSLTNKYDLSSLQQITSGAAPLGGATTALARLKFKGIIFKQAYGMTESSPVITAQLPNDQVDGSSGILIPNMLARVIDPQSGKEITSYNTPGELWVCGPNVTLGYLKKEKETNETYTFDESGRRWLHTGDEVEVRLSEKGQEHFWIVDRIKELIKVLGYQVPPAELEALLLSHELIEDAAVIGVPDEYAGELPKAFIVLKPGTKGDKKLAAEIQKWVEERKVRYKWLRGGIEFLESIPKTPSGKILRKDLRLREKEKMKAKL